MILERYIHREIFEKLGWVAGLLTLILASNRFVDYLADAAAGKMPGNLILQMLFMRITAMLPRLLPIAFFLAVMLALSRLARDRELTVVSGAGIGGSFQFKAVFSVAAVFATMVAVLGFYLAPIAEGRVEALKDRAKVESDISGITAGQFKEFSQGEKVVYTQGMSPDRQSMHDVFLQVNQHDHLGVLSSRSARYTVDRRSGRRYILFESGHRYVGTPGTANYQITQYRNYGVLLDESGDDPGYEQLEALPTSTLIGSDKPMYKAELQWRLSYVLAAILLPLLGVAMNRFAFSEQRYMPLFVAVLIYFIYSNLLGISKTLLKRDQIPAFVGLWWVHVLLIIIIVVIAEFPVIRVRFRRREAAAPSH